MNLLRANIELWHRMRWLKQINKSVKKRDKFYEQYKRYDYVAKSLLAEYEKRYPMNIDGSERNAE